MPSHSEFDDEKQKEKMLQEWLDQNQYTRYVTIITLSMFSCWRRVLTMLICCQERNSEVRGYLRPDVCQRWRGDHYQRLRREAGPQAGNEGKNIWMSVENICVRMENICVQIENICKSGIFSCCSYVG